MKLPRPLRIAADRGRQRGSSVLASLLLVALVVVLSARVMDVESRWYRQVKLEGDRLQAQALADAAVDFGRAVLADDERRDSVDHPGEAWAQSLPPMSVEGGLLSGAIEDAQGRLNLNAILTEPQPLGRLFDRLGLSPELLAALGDAADTDSETRFPGGAEDQYYLAAEPPRRAANGALVVKEDLLSIRGFDAFVLKRLQDSVVVLPAGSGQANINTASDEVLMAVIPGLAPAQAAALRRDVEQTPVRVVSDVIERLRKVGWSGEGAPPLGVSSRYFFVRGEVRWGEASARMRVAVERMGAGTAPRILWKKMEVLE